MVDKKIIAEIKKRYKKKERTHVIAFKMGLSCNCVNGVIQQEKCSKDTYVTELTMRIFRAVKAAKRFDIRDVQLLTDATSTQAKNAIAILKTHKYIKKIGRNDRFAIYLVVKSDDLHSYIEKLKVRRK